MTSSVFAILSKAQARGAAALALAFGVVGESVAVAETIESREGARLEATEIARFDEPWAMTFLPDDRMLVTEKAGTLQLVSQDGGKSQVEGLWPVAYGGQGGLGDVVLHPNYAENGWIYISNAESDERGLRGAVLRRARLDESGEAPKLIDIETIWTQQPKVSGRGHYSHRVLFGPDGMMFVTSGDRQKQDPAQNFTGQLGKVLRLHDDGSVPDDNPWIDQGEVARSFWSMGHRNMLGAAFDAEGRLWVHEMGPRDGDELNLVKKGANQGWPEVSMGRHYSGFPIPDHAEGDGFDAPEAFWVPTIAPAGLVIYSGDLFPDWTGDAFIGGLASQALIRVDLDGESAAEADRFDMDERIREVEQGPDGALWLLEDGGGARLLKLTPAG